MLRKVWGSGICVGKVWKWMQIPDNHPLGGHTSTWGDLPGPNHHLTLNMTLGHDHEAQVEVCH